MIGIRILVIFVVVRFVVAVIATFVVVISFAIAAIVPTIPDVVILALMSLSLP